MKIKQEWMPLAQVIAHALIAVFATLALIGANNNVSRALDTVLIAYAVVRVVVGLWGRPGA